MKKEQDKSVLVNVSWEFAERTCMQAFTMIISVIIARHVEPSLYGVVATVTAINTLFNVFVDSGLGISLVQKKNADDLDFSTVFWANLSLCTLFYILLFIISPFISAFFGNEKLTNLIRVSGISVVFFSLKNIQQSYISKNMMFRKFFFASLFGTVMGGAVGVWLAINGFGEWALIFSNLVDIICDTIILWIITEWRPSFIFSFSRLTELFRYGSRIIVSSFIDVLFDKIKQLIIPKKYSSEDLAYYEKGDSLSSKITNNINASISSVLFPAMSNVQDDENKLVNIIRSSMKVNFYIMTPLLLGLAVIADKAITVVLTEKWLPTVPYLRILCVLRVLRPIHTANLSAIKAIGKSDTMLKMEIYKKIVSIILLLLTVNISPLAMTIGFLVSDIICVFINTYPSGKNLNYSLVKQLNDLLPTIIISIIMVIVVSLVSNVGKNIFVSMVIQIAVGILAYVSLSIFTKNDSFFYLLNKIKKF